MTEKNGTSAWQNSIVEFGPPLRGYFFGRIGLSFGRKKLLAPPKKCPKNAYDTKPVASALRLHIVLIKFSLLTEEIPSVVQFSIYFFIHFVVSLPSDEVFQKH